MKNLMTTLSTASALLLTSAFLVACDSDDDDSKGQPVQESSNTITDIASTNGDFDTLTTALEAAGLAETLKGEGPFTVFAPTDAAFEALPEGTLDSLLADTDALSDVLLYHVVSGNVTAEQVVTLSSATTLQGQDVSIEVREGNVFLNGNVQVVQTDIAADNGVIHVIDAVLIPEDEEPEPSEPGTIPEVAQAAGSFQTLLTAVTAAGLADTLSGEGPFTVFAPTDDVFAALPEGTLDGLLEDKDALTEVLLYHVVAGDVRAETVVTLSSATTLADKDITIEVVDGEVILNGTVKVVTTDIEASNGVIHVIDGVLLPPADEEPGNIVEVATAAGVFNTLLAAATAANLADTLATGGPFTVFAPTDDAFAKLPEGTVESLLEDPEGALTDILLYHVVDGIVPASEVVNLTSATTLGGEDVTISVEGGEVSVNQSIVIQTDVAASNGIIHVIDTVLIPPSM